MFCTAEYAPADPADAFRRLAELPGFDIDDDDDQLVETVELEDGRVIRRGTVRRTEAGTLVLDTNALERLRRLQGLLLEIEPGARLVSESSVPWERAVAEQADQPDEPDGDRVPPEVEAELLDELMWAEEQRWLDASVPALGGLTPREATATPSARPELEALLDDLEWRRTRMGGGGLDARRIRSALGLPTAERAPRPATSPSGRP